MKKVVFSAVGILIFVIGAWTIGTGFRKETTAFVYDFTVNSDNSVMTIHAGVGSSIGFIRDVVINQNEEGDIRLDFISAFGGLNGSIGAKNTYEIPLDEYSSSISVYQGNQYRLILEKDINSGEWSPVDWIPASAR